jgi:hypothetical protein
VRRCSYCVVFDVDNAQWDLNEMVFPSQSNQGRSFQASNRTVIPNMLTAEGEEGVRKEVTSCPAGDVHDLRKTSPNSLSSLDGW